MPARPVKRMRRRGKPLAAQPKAVTHCRGHHDQDAHHWPPNKTGWITITISLHYFFFTTNTVYLSLWKVKVTHDSFCITGVIWSWNLITKNSKQGTNKAKRYAKHTAFRCYHSFSQRLLLLLALDQTALEKNNKKLRSVVNYLRRAESSKKWIKWPYLSNKAMIDSTSCFSFSHWKKYWYS